MRVSPNNAVSLTAEEIDAALAEWRRRIGNVSENLLALYDVTAMKRMEGRDGFTKVPFTGVTAARVAPALDAVQEMFAQLGTLNQYVDRAEALRKSLTRLRRYDETREEITRLLVGNCVPLPPDQTPLASRSLVSVSQRDRAMSLDCLLSEMTAEFETTKASVLAIDAAWSRFEPQLDAALAKLTALTERAEALGLDAPAELRATLVAIEALKARVLCDPLGVGDEFNQTINPMLDAARSQMDEVAKRRAAFTDQIEQAQKLQAELTRIAGISAATYTEARARISDPDGRLLQPPQADPSSLTQMTDWLASLTAAYRSAQWKPLQVGLQRYLDAVTQLIEKERAALQANRAAMEAIPELKGRLSIVETRARQSANPPVDAVSRLSAQAQTLLQENPVPLAQATRLVEACEARLRQKIA